MNISEIKDLLFKSGLSTNEYTSLIINYIQANHDALSQEIEDISNNLSLDTATGKFLDYLGLLVGNIRDRISPIKITNEPLMFGISENYNIEDFYANGSTSIYIPKSAIYFTDDRGIKYFPLADIILDTYHTKVGVNIVFNGNELDSDHIPALSINTIHLNFSIINGLNTDAYVKDLFFVNNNATITINSEIKKASDEEYRFILFKQIQSHNQINKDYIMAQLLDVEDVVRVHPIVSLDDNNTMIFYIETVDPRNDDVIISICQTIVDKYKTSNATIAKPIYRELDIVLENYNDTLADNLKLLIENAKMGDTIVIPEDTYNLKALYIDGREYKSNVLKPWWNEKYLINSITSA